VVLFLLSLVSVDGANLGDVHKVIADSDSCKTITLQNTTYYGDGSQIAISKSITIQGHSGQYATLDAKGESRFIRTTTKPLFFISFLTYFCFVLINIQTYLYKFR